MNFKWKMLFLKVRGITLDHFCRSKLIFMRHLRKKFYVSISLQKTWQDKKWRVTSKVISQFLINLFAHLVDLVQTKNDSIKSKN